MRIIRSNKSFFLVALFYIIAGLIVNIAFTQKELFFFVNGGMGPVQDPLMYYYTNVGDGLFAAAVILILAFVRLKYAIAALVAAVLQGVVVQVLKHLVFSGYHRPYKMWGETDTINLLEGLNPHLHNSMPSGHTATAFCIFTILALYSRYKPAGLIFFMAAFAVGYSRVYLAQHMIIDTYIGSLIGMASALAVYAYVFSDGRKFSREDHWMNRRLHKLRGGSRGS